MCKVQMLRALVEQRLTAAAEEIFGLFERTIAEYEEELCRSKEENERQRELLDAVYNPQLRLHRADVQQLSVVKDWVPPEQQECSSSVDQQQPEPPPHIKKELWSSQEGEQLQGLEEADITKLPITPVPAKSEDDEKKTDDSADWKETREPQSALNSLKHDSRCKKKFSCSECGKRFGFKTHLKKHVRIHTGEKPFSCSECGKAFTESGHLKRHMITHTGEKPFGCSVCKKSFTQSGHLRSHMVVHTGEKRFSCSVCNKRFAGHSRVKRHKCVGQMETS
ncbi:zinc finger protein 41 homolog [Sander lucioperca]|uniref:zinc finger protein 41 homolog n=1 Tax=Sander lucioperca TaxID=283035 RepID=UPI00165385DF|nr:zinc finger protein 41 homolog [Sander lucioperca]